MIGEHGDGTAHLGLPHCVVDRVAHGATTARHEHHRDVGELGQGQRPGWQVGAGGIGEPVLGLSELDDLETHLVLDGRWVTTNSQ